MVDYYKRRLAAAKWGWMESHRWHQGKFRKDRENGRHEKRAARQEAKRDTDSQLE